MFQKKSDLAGIEYMGSSGISLDCQHAIMRLIQYGQPIEHARILTCSGDSHVLKHSFLLTVLGDKVVIKSGFTSGYSGGGPHAFSFILALLYSHEVEIDECEISSGLLERIELSALTVRDLLKIESAKSIHPSRWTDYVFEKHWPNRVGPNRLGIDGIGRLWNSFPDVLPFSVLDDRLADLAMKFHAGPDAQLLTGYRRLETIVRERTGLNEHGAKLFSQAFAGKDPKLIWVGLHESEQIGRLSLFTGAYMAYRNPRAHSERREYNIPLNEFLLLNQLFCLERESKLKSEIHEQADDPEADS